MPNATLTRRQWRVLAALCDGGALRLVDGTGGGSWTVSGYVRKGGARATTRTTGTLVSRLAGRGWLTLATAFLDGRAALTQDGAAATIDAAPRSKWNPAVAAARKAARTRKANAAGVA